MGNYPIGPDGSSAVTFCAAVKPLFATVLPGFSVPLTPWRETKNEKCRSFKK
jgi:hypothetical protein